MSKLSKIFSDIPVDIQNRSGFDMSHYNIGDGRTGTLIPVLCEEMLPNDSVSLGFMDKIQLLPMATNFSGRIDMRFEAFFVPNRILWGGWQDFQTLPDNNPYQTPFQRPILAPYFTNGSEISGTSASSFFTQHFGPQTLFDYLGYGSSDSSWSGSAGQTLPPNSLSISALPFIAYQRVYDDWYRNPRITQPLFVRPSSSVEGSSNRVYSLPWIQKLSFYPNSSDVYDSAIPLENNFSMSQLADGSHLTDLRQRCWGDDYLTTCALYPQASGSITGNPISVQGDSFTISDLRTANVLQRWAERRNVAGPRYADQLLATWGVMPSDAIIDRPIYLGSYSHGVYTSPIFNTNSISSNPEGDSDGQGLNPYSKYPASSAGQSDGVGQGSLVDNFHVTEHGFLMVIASLVPHAFYSTYKRSYLKRKKIADFANPLLQGLGEQAVTNDIVLGDNYTQLIQKTNEGTWGYTPQYSDYKYHCDEVHGTRRGNNANKYFALQRSILASEDWTLSTAFLEIPTDFLDQVSNVSTANSGCSYMYDIYFSLKIVRTLSEYVIPTLGDLKDVHKERIPFRGRQIKG